MENIPPTSAALKLHILRSALKAIMWHQWYKKDRVMPNITDWGWTKTSNGYVPKWSESPEASIACRELIKCGCKKVVKVAASARSKNFLVQSCVLVLSSVCNYNYIYRIIMELILLDHILCILYVFLSKLLFVEIEVVILFI